MAKTTTQTTAPRVKFVEGQLVHTEFMTEDAPALRKFFEKNFGWKFDSYKNPDGTEYHLFTTPGTGMTGGGLGEPNADQGQAVGTTSYIFVDDIKATEKKLRKAGAEIVVPPLEIPGFGIMLQFRYKGSPLLACFEGTTPME